MNDRRAKYEIRTINDAAIIEWDDRRGRHQFRIDCIPATQPRWLGAAAELEAETDRRREAELVDVLRGFGRSRGETVALYHAAGNIEYLLTLEELEIDEC